MATGATAGPALELRCCRGLAALTLKKRVSDFRSFLRFLWSRIALRLPTEESHVLELISVREAEQAARSSFKDLLTSPNS